GETPGALRAVAGALGAAIAGAPDTAGQLWPELAAFAPVHAHKSRHECVLLPFEALTRALDQAEADAG
ncbi:MAG: iron-sulfur cluster assembly scaffold protein, partial [Geminicoccaceae bacterium]